MAASRNGAAAAVTGPVTREPRDAAKFEHGPRETRSDVVEGCRSRVNPPTRLAVCGGRKPDVGDIGRERVLEWEDRVAT